MLKLRTDREQNQGHTLELSPCQFPQGNQCGSVGLTTYRDGSMDLVPPKPTIGRCLSSRTCRWAKPSRTRQERT